MLCVPDSTPILRCRSDGTTPALGRADEVLDDPENDGRAGVEILLRPAWFQSGTKPCATAQATSAERGMPQWTEKLTMRLSVRLAVSVGDPPPSIGGLVYSTPLRISGERARFALWVVQPPHGIQALTVSLWACQNSQSFVIVASGTQGRNSRMMSNCGTGTIVI